jgi:Adaptive response protein AidB N-terminal domain
MAHSSVSTGFFQSPPSLPDPYTSDVLLQRILRRYLGPDLHSSLAPEFARLGSQAVSREMLALCADAHRNLPSVVQYDGWGARVDELVVANGWKKLKGVWAESGMLGDIYLRRYGEKSRFVGMIKYVRCVSEGNVLGFT